MITCQCKSCGGNIEFNPAPGHVHLLLCPHCGAQTQFHVTQTKAQSYRAQRVTLTKTQCTSQEGQELIEQLRDIGERGSFSREHVQRLADWLNKKSRWDIRATRFLSEIAAEKLSKTEFTQQDAFEVLLAIERVLPTEARSQVAAKRREAWGNKPATESELRWMRNLGGSPEPGITSAEAPGLITHLGSRASPKQVAYLSYLGVGGAEDMTREEASQQIEQLFETTDPVLSEKLRRRRDDWMTDRMVLHPDLYKDEVAHMLEVELPEFLHGYVRSRVVGAAEKLTKERVKTVMASLTTESPLWWQANNKSEKFFERLAVMFPACVAGRAPGKTSRTSSVQVPAELLQHLAEEEDRMRRTRVVKAPPPTVSPASKGSGCLTVAFLIAAGVLLLMWKVLAR